MQLIASPGVPEKSFVSKDKGWPYFGGCKDGQNVLKPAQALARTLTHAEDQRQKARHGSRTEKSV